MRYTLAEAAAFAEPRGILIGIEPHQQYSKSPEGLDRIFKLVKSPVMGINFDTGNSYLSGHDPIAWLKRVVFRGRCIRVDEPLPHSLGNYRDAKHGCSVVVQLDDVAVPNGARISVLRMNPRRPPCISIFRRASLYSHTHNATLFSLAYYGHASPAAWFMAFCHFHYCLVMQYQALF